MGSWGRACPGKVDWTCLTFGQLFVSEPGKEEKGPRDSEKNNAIGPPSPFPRRRAA